MGRAGAAGGPLVLGGGARPRQRSGRKTDWTEAMAGKFIAVLADTCNVTLAAQAIKRSIANVYKQRSKNATFRGAWDAALAAGYARLEMMMLERALHGVEKTVVARDGTTTVMRHYSDRVALTLLRMHRDSVAATEDGVAEDEAREACERIVAKFQRLRELECGEVETKGLIDRLEMIRWALCGGGPGKSKSR